MKSRTVILAAVAFCVTIPVSAQAPPTKVGIISIQGAIAGTKDGQKALQQLNAKFQPKQKEFDQRQSELAQLQNQYDKGAGVLNEEKRNELVRAIDQKRKMLDRDTADAKDEFTSEQQRVFQDVGQKMVALIEKYAQEHGYSLVLDASNPNTSLLYAAPAIDLTQDIIALYDKSSMTSSTIAPARPSAK